LMLVPEMWKIAPPLRHDFTRPVARLEIFQLAMSRYFCSQCPSSPCVRQT
jgi:hypothetical protein